MKKLFLLFGLLGAMGSSAFAQVNIPNLPASSGTINNADLLIIEQNNFTYKITAAQAKTFFAAGSSYTLPVATLTLLGGVKQGANVNIADDGTITTTSLAFSLISNKPTTLSGYGITDGVSTGSSYTDPSWITSLSYAKLAGAPIAGTKVISNGSLSVNVTGLALGFTPSFVLVTIRKDSTTSGSLAWGTVEGPSLSSDGFTVDLSGYIGVVAPPTGGNLDPTTWASDGITYHLDYLIVK